MPGLTSLPIESRLYINQGVEEVGEGRKKEVGRRENFYMRAAKVMGGRDKTSEGNVKATTEGNVRAAIGGDDESDDRAGRGCSYRLRSWGMNHIGK